MSSPAATEGSVESLHRPARLNLQEFSRELARWSGASGEVVERDGILLYATATSFPVTCNGVLRLVPEVADEVVLDLAESWFGARSRGYTLQLADRAGVRDFVAVSDAAYQSLGMTPGVITEMTLDLDRLLEPHLAQVVAYAGAQPVAAAQLLLSHGIGGVYYVGTVEAARGRGLGELVTRAVTNRGFDSGASFVCLQATAMGEPVYRRMGYREIGRYEGLVRFV